MATRNLRLRYRPIRIGWCVRYGSMEDVRKVLKLTHTLWGGSYNPIIPVGGKLPAKELIDVYRVDALYPSLEEGSLRAFIDSFPHLRWPLYDEELFVGDTDGRTFATLLDVYHPVRKIFEEFVKTEKEPQSRATVFKWSEEDPLPSVFLSFFGSYPAKAEVGTDYEEFVFKSLLANRVVLSAESAISAEAYKTFTPSAIAGYELRGDRLPNWDYPGLYWGNSGDFEDVVNFWNLRAA